MAATRIGVAPPAQVNARPDGRYRGLAESVRYPRTKDGAIAFVSAVMQSPLALTSPDFQVAIDLSERFDIRAGDILEYRKKRCAVIEGPAT